MSALNIIIAVLLVATLAEISSARVQSKVDVFRLGQANNYFGVNLHKRLVDETDGNVFFSPFSVSSVLAMLYRGARNETAEELRSILGYGRLADSTVFNSYQHYLNGFIGKMDPRIYTIHCVSAMIVDGSFPVLPRYKLEMQDLFQAYVQDVNLSEESATVVDQMNTWVKIKTKGAISCLADHIDPETTLFLTSAAYFKGSWKVKFDPEDTKPHLFYNGGQPSSARNVPMMHCYASIRYFEDDGENFTAVELAYEGRNMSMVIYLPSEIDGLEKLEQDLDSSMMTYVRRQMYYMKVHLTLPKFKLEMDRSLSKALKGLGLSKIFNYGADLSGMIPQNVPLALNDVKHKAFIEVDEEGSIAAAITRVIMTKSMPLPIPDPEFKVDRPFLFAIFDTWNELVLFMGRVKEL